MILLFTKTYEKCVNKIFTQEKYNINLYIYIYIHDKNKTIYNILIKVI